MRETINQKWVSKLAEELLCEVIDQMSGIHLAEVPDMPTYFGTRQLDAVCGKTTGDFTLLMRLVAERRLFERLAEKMIGSPPSDQEEVEEYATEFFNIICGRFVSELYHLTGQSARFLPTTYERPFERTDIRGRECVNTVKFISDKDEGVIFSWALASQRV